MTQFCTFQPVGIPAGFSHCFVSSLCYTFFENTKHNHLGKGEKIVKSKTSLVIALCLVAIGTAANGYTDNSLYLFVTGAGLGMLIGYFRPRSMQG